MKANELKLGNRVLARCQMHHNFYEETVISGINEDEVHHDAVGFNCTIYNDIENIKPITLEEEWLMLFGFDKANEEWFEKNTYHTNSPFGFINVNKELNKVTVSGAQSEFTISSEVNYVHQLQNLYFALIGEELELKNECKCEYHTYSSGLKTKVRTNGCTKCDK